MYELEIGEAGQEAFAYISTVDLMLERDRIYLGDLSLFVDEVTDFVIGNVEAIITHESVHIAIYKNTESILTVRNFDNIDNPMAEGGVYPVSRTLQ